MDVTKIRLIGLHTVDLPLYVAKPSDPYIIKAADGLGPTGADVFISGNVYQRRQPLSRELVFRIGLTPNFRVGETAASLRERLYGMLTPTTEDDSVPVQFMRGDTVVAQTVARVSKIELALFATEPEVQMTMPCTGSYLEAPDELTVSPVVEDTFTVPNMGTAPTGIEMRVQFTSNVSSWSLGFGSKKMQFDFAFQAGDILTVNTKEGQKSVKHTRAGLTKEIIHALSRDSQWVLLHGGDNVFMPSSYGFDLTYIRYRPLYLGV